LYFRGLNFPLDTTAIGTRSVYINGRPVIADGRYDANAGARRVLRG
jgi:hypothetical protein